MMPSVLRAGFRDHCRHPLPTALILLGIALGVGVVFSVDLTIQSATRSFALSVDTLSDRATHRIHGGPSGLLAEDFAALAKDFAELSPTPLIERDAEALASGRRKKLLGIDPWAETKLRPSFSLDQDSEALDAGRLATTKGGCWLSARHAAQEGLSVGQSFAVRIGSRVQSLMLLATFAPADEVVAQATEDLILVDLATAEELIERYGRLDRVDLFVTQGSEARLQALRAALPPGIALEAIATERSALERMMEAFRANLQFLSLLALLVGGLLVFNAMGFSVSRRLPLFARLRAFGVTRQEVLTAILSEGLLFGLCGSGLGLLLGYGLATALVGTVSQTIGDLYHASLAPSLLPRTSDLLLAASLGLLTTLLSVLAPASRASRESPLAQLKKSHSGRRLQFRLEAIFALLGLIGLLLFALLPQQPLWPATLLLASLVLLASAVAPAVLFAWTHALEALPFVRRRLLLRLSLRGARAALMRTRTAITALAFALAMSLGVTLMIGSFRGAVTSWLDRALVGDVFVSLPRGVARTPGKDPLPQPLVTRLAASDSVRAMITNRVVTVQSSLGPVQLCAFGYPTFDTFAVDLLVGDKAQAYEAYRLGKGLLATEPLVRRHGLNLGDLIQLSTPERGPLSLPIVAILRDFATEAGYLVLAAPHYREAYGDAGISTLSLVLKPGIDPETFGRDFERSLGADERLDIRTNRQIFDFTMAVFDRTFRVTGALRSLALIVAIIAFLGAVLSLQLDREGEFARLTARGFNDREALIVRLLQSGFEGLVAGTIAIPLGIAFAAVLTQVIQVRSFGWSLPLELSLWPLLETPFFAILSALFAGLLATRFRKKAPLTARLREE